MYCKYYQATTFRSKTWFVVGCIKNESKIAFARTFDTPNSILEIFVIPEFEDHFLDIMEYLKENGYVLELKKLPNRLKD